RLDGVQDLVHVGGEHDIAVPTPCVLPEPHELAAGHHVLAACIVGLDVEEQCALGEVGKDADMPVHGCGDVVLRLGQTDDAAEGDGRGGCGHHETDPVRTL